MSKLSVINRYSRLKFATFVVAPTLTLLSTWIHWRVPFPKVAGYYFATGDASTIQGYAEALGIEQAFQTFLFTSFSVILFLLFRMALSNLLSLFALVMFMTNAQVVLVYLSAPFWDFSTAIIPLAAITGTIALLHPQHQNFCLSRKMRSQLSVTIIGLNFVIVVLYLRVYNLKAAQSSSIFVSALVIFIVIFFWLKNGKKKAKIDSGIILRPSENDRLFLIPVLFTLFILQPILGRSGGSYALVTLSICFFFFLIAENGLRKRYKLLIATLFLLVVQFRTSNSHFKIFSFIGWYGAEPLLSGRGGRIHALGVPRSDFLMWNLSEAIAPSFGSYFQWATINASIAINNVKVGGAYLSNGFWTFSEPPLGLNNSAIYMGRHQLIASMKFLAPILFIYAAIFSFQKSRKITFFIALIATSLVSAIGFSYPQMHQWWAAQIFGIYGALYALSRLGGTMFSGLFSRNLSSNRRKGITNRCSQLIFHLRSNIPKKSLLQFLLVLLIVAVGPRAVFSVLNHASESLEKNRLEELATRYASQYWQLITINKNSGKFDLNKDSSLIKIEVSDNCNLAGLKVHYLNSNAPGLETGDFYRTKFYIANTSSKIVYIPFFPIGIARPTISIGGLNSSCSPRVYQSNLKERSFPLVALLVPNDENTESQFSTHGTKTDLGVNDLLSSPFSFEGYVNNRGYQAVGDELEHEWLKNQIGDRILGRSKQGFQEIDIWREEIGIKNDGLRVRVRGEISRGVLVIGWSKSKSSSPDTLPMEFDYAIRGSIFDTTTRDLDECFELKGFNTDADVAKVELFIGSVFDLYSPRWTSFKITSITLDRGSCESNLQPTNFLPTL